jgi:ribosomal protein S18 acetylase RimI-like enzyme
MFWCSANIAMSSPSVVVLKLEIPTSLTIQRVTGHSNQLLHCIFHGMQVRQACTACSTSVAGTASGTDRLWSVNVTKCVQDGLLNGAYFTFEGFMVVLRTVGETALAQIFVHHADQKASLLSVYVCPGMRGRGLASALVVAMAYCAAHIFSTTILIVEDSSDRAGARQHNLYRSLGFSYPDESDFCTDEPMSVYIRDLLPTNARSWAASTAIRWPHMMPSSIEVCSGTHTDHHTKATRIRGRHDSLSPVSSGSMSDQPNTPTKKHKTPNFTAFLSGIPDYTGWKARRSSPFNSTSNSPASSRPSTPRLSSGGSDSLRSAHQSLPDATRTIGSAVVGARHGQTKQPLANGYNQSLISDPNLPIIQASELMELLYMPHTTCSMCQKRK